MAVPRRRVGIFAGVGKHLFDPTLGVAYADTDCQKLADAFCHKQRFGFTEKNVRILRASDPNPANRPLRSVLLATIWDDLAGEKIDLLVLYLAMHGVEHDGHTYLVPQDGIARHRETLISLRDLLAKMAGVDARQRLVIFDGCHGGGVGRILPASFASDIGDMADLTVLSACDIGEASHECHERRGGVYSGFFTDALHEEPIDSENRLPLSRVHERAARSTKAWADERGYKQSPRDFANRRTTIDLLPPSGDMMPVPRKIEDKTLRTSTIIRILKHLLKDHRMRIGLGPFFIRIYARLSSFAVADNEKWRQLDPSYFDLVKEERDLLLELMHAGAYVKLVLSWDADDLMDFRKVDLEQRLLQLRKVFSEVLEDERQTARFLVVRSPNHDRNFLALDDLYVIIGRKLNGPEGGVDVTQILQDPTAVRDEIGFFDTAFENAFKEMCREEGRDPDETDNAALLRSALLEIEAGLRILRNGPSLPHRAGHSKPPPR
jgi:hypothetical protein